jgi:hypothetical protein
MGPEEQALTLARSMQFGVGMAIKGRRPPAKLDEMTVRKVERKSASRPSGPGDATAPIKREPENRRGAMRGSTGAQIRASSSK